MAKHDNKIADQFKDNLKDLDTMSEQDLLNRLNETIIAVENDDSYNTNEKLKIYACISSISNVDEKDRKKFVMNTYKALR